MSVSNYVSTMQEYQEKNKQYLSLLAKDTEKGLKRVLPQAKEVIEILSEVCANRSLWRNIYIPKETSDSAITVLTGKECGEEYTDDTIVIAISGTDLWIDADGDIIHSSDDDADPDEFTCDGLDEDSLFRIRRAIVLIDEYNKALHKDLDAIMANIDDSLAQAKTNNFPLRLPNGDTIEEEISLEEVKDEDDTSEEEDEIVVEKVESESEAKETEDEPEVADEDTEEADDVSESEETDDTEENTIEEEVSAEDADADSEEAKDSDDEPSEEFDSEDEDTSEDESFDESGEDIDNLVEDDAVSVNLDEMDSEVTDDKEESVKDEGVSMFAGDSVDNNTDDLFGDEDEEFVPKPYTPEPELDETLLKEHVNIEFTEDAGKNVMKFPLQYMLEAKSNPFKQFIEASFPLKDESGIVKIQAQGRFCKVVDDETAKIILDDKTHYMVFTPSGKESMTVDALREFCENEIL